MPKDGERYLARSVRPDPALSVPFVGAARGVGAGPACDACAVRKRSVWVGAVAGAVALAAAVALVARDGDETVRGGATEAVGSSSDGASSELERRELYAANAVAVHDEVWVFGGVSGPDGSAPPSTSMLPPGWVANDTVTAYAVDGTVRRRIELDGLGQRTIVGGRVVAVGDDRYLVGGLCNGALAGGCGASIDPVLLRFDGDDAVRVPLQLPAASLGEEVGAGFVSVLGQGDDGVVWATQDIADSSMLPGVQPVRLLAIDVSTGVGTEVPLPDGLVNRGTLCVEGEHLYATQAELGDSRLTSVRLLKRPATNDPAEWQPIITPELDLERVSGGTLHCLPAGELALTVGAYPQPYVITYNAATAAPVHDPVDLSVDGGAWILGEVSGHTVLQVAVGRERTGFMVHEPGGGWTRSETEINRDSFPLVVEGELRDVQFVVASTAPTPVEIPQIQV